MISISFINPLSDEGRQIVREEGSLDTIFDYNHKLVTTVEKGSQEISDDNYIPKNYVDLAIKRIEWHMKKNSEDNFNYGKYAFLFNNNINKFDVIAFYLLCQAIGVKFGPNSREGRVMVESQGHIIENRMGKLLKSEKREITGQILNSLIIQDKIKWQSLEELLSSKKINLQELILDNGQIILNKEDFIEKFADKVDNRDPGRMYDLLIGDKIKELIIIKKIMQNTENYISSVYERSKRDVEPNQSLLKIADRISEALKEQTKYYKSSYGGDEMEASPLNSEAFPPCVKKSLEGIKSGGRNEVIVLFLTPFLSYTRLYPSVFSRNITMKVSDIDPDLKILNNEILPLIYDAAERCSPPLFDDQPQEKININAKLGFGMHDKPDLKYEGETNWYSPMNCEKVKLQIPGICQPDKICEKIGNPLSYYKRKMWAGKSKK